MPVVGSIYYFPPKPVYTYMTVPMEVYTKAPTDYRIENCNTSSGEEPKLEKHIFIELVTENNTSKSIRMSALQFNNLRHNVANLLKQTNRLKAKLQQN